MFVVYKLMGNGFRWCRYRAKHEGKGLSTAWFEATKNAGIDIRYGSGALQLIQNDKGKVVGVVTKEDDGIKKLYSNAVVLGCGGFEANSQKAQYLGAQDTAKVRGTSFYQGDGLKMALSIGAMPFGQWTGNIQHRLMQIGESCR